MKDKFCTSYGKKNHGDTDGDWIIGAMDNGSLKTLSTGMQGNWIRAHSCQQIREHGNSANMLDVYVYPDGYK